MSRNHQTPLQMKKEDIHVTSDLLCKRLMHNVIPHTRTGKARIKDCKFEIHDYCFGTKIVNIKAGSVIHKFHDGCLQRISYKLANLAKRRTDVVIDDCFDPDIVTKALTYVLKARDISITRLSTNEKYGMMLFGARYGLPPEHMKKLIDRSIYGDLVQYAWENNNVYLMEMLPKVRIPDINFLEDFKKVEEQIMVQFVPMYVDYENFLEVIRCCKIVWLISMMKDGMLKKETTIVLSDV